ncbi:MAG TPA: NADH-quinone oxidoreductase subunit C [bacterium]|nr:NADH-quinone oxidoreductase subunit C [bacterium]HOL34614.1 NADH-quinone oxidoreductase subunit C [bacterium]HPP08140.1 NADH-quinone oxidoreductase subunit C [bacterium]
MEIIEQVKEKFKSKIKSVFFHNEKRVYLEIDKEDLIDVVKFIFHDLDARFITASGIDNLKDMEILYHFSLDSDGIVISLRVFIDRDNPCIESITSIVKGALNIEREMYELLGIKFLNHPGLKRFLTDEFPEGFYPLRKDSPGRAEQ